MNVSGPDAKTHGRTAAREQFIHELPTRMLMLAATWEDFARKSDEEMGFLEELASVLIVADTLKDLCKTKDMPEVSSLLDSVEAGLNNLPESTAERRTLINQEVASKISHLVALAERMAGDGSELVVGAPVATLEQALPLRDKFIGIGLDSSELGHPPEKFANVFARCRGLGLRLVAHAGEEGPPAYVWSALDVLQVERIDHGVQSTQDPLLVQRLARDRIPLTVCPLSNLKLRVFSDLADHNLGQLLDAGLVATVNSDDPAYFGGYLNENFTQIFAATGLTVQHAYQLAANSFEASFIGAGQKQALVDKLQTYFKNFE